MIALLEAHRAQIGEICRHYDVAQLDLFGSATNDRFTSAQSDFDLIVRFANPETPGIARRFIDLAEALEQLLGQPVDLLFDQPFSNPYFAQSVAETRQTIYDQSNEKVLV